MIDKRALKILSDTYWSSTGWKEHGVNPFTPPEDLAYAMKKGLMFAPEVIGHDEAVERVLAVRSRIGANDVASAFLASLTSQRLDLRSSLGSFAVARHRHPREHSGFFTSFVDHDNRTETPWHKDGWPYPVGWWKGADGVNVSAFDFWFGEIT